MTEGMFYETPEFSQADERKAHSALVEMTSDKHMEKAKTLVEMADKQVEVMMERNQEIPLADLTALVNAHIVLAGVLQSSDTMRSMALTLNKITEEGR